MLKRKHKLILLLTTAIVGIILAFFVSPIAQNPEYHNFADGREFLSVPNFYNVISNLPFLIVGSIGIFISLYIRSTKEKEKDPLLPANLCFFTGIFLTGIGSVYYHLQPCTATLIWDRLPMTLTFMAFFAIIISEHIDPVLGKWLLFYLIFLGIISVAYWYMTEWEGHGGLRFYALVQFLPLLLIPLILILFRKESPYAYYYWAILVVYILAKFCEVLDYDLFISTGLISGHSLKHLTASLAPFIYFLKLWKEKTQVVLRSVYS